MIDGSFPAVPPPATSDEARLEELNEVLSHHRRRTVLGVLREGDTKLPVEELARRVASRERGRSYDALPRDEPETIRLTLEHTRRPRLVGSDVVECDPSKRTIEFRAPKGVR